MSRAFWRSVDQGVVVHRTPGSEAPVESGPGPARQDVVDAVQGGGGVGVDVPHIDFVNVPLGHEVGKGDGVFHGHGVVGPLFDGRGRLMGGDVGAVAFGCAGQPGVGLGQRIAPVGHGGAIVEKDEP